MNKKIYTAKQLSLYLNIPKRTIYHLTKQGKIKGVKLGKHWRYMESDIEDCLSYGTDFFKSPVRIPHNSLKNTQECSDFIERRAYPRMNCHIEGNYAVDLPKKDKSVKSIITNISGNGLLIYDMSNINNVNVEDPVKLNFQLGQNGNAIELEGRIVRKTNESFGVKFRNINKDCENLIINYVG